MDSAPQTLYKCPSCGDLNNVVTAADEFICDSCDMVVKLSGHYCPECFEYSGENRASCTYCEGVLMRSCSLCGRANWSGRLSCSYCGQELDFFTIVSERYSPTSTAERLQDQMRQTKAIRAIDDAASSSNMEELNLAEQVRMNEVWNQEKRIQRRDRQLIAAAVALLLLFLIAIVIFSLIS